MGGAMRGQEGLRAEGACRCEEWQEGVREQRQIAGGAGAGRSLQVDKRWLTARKEVRAEGNAWPISTQPSLHCNVISHLVRCFLKPLSVP